MCDYRGSAADKEIIDKAAQAAVTSGVKWLAACPGVPIYWPNLVDTDKLNMMDGELCVLGQVFASAAEEATVNGFGYAMDTYKLSPGKLSSLGFVSAIKTTDYMQLTTWTLSHSAYDDTLRNCWSRTIKALQQLPEFALPA